MATDQFLSLQESFQEIDLSGVISQDFYCGFAAWRNKYDLISLIYTV